MKNKVSKGLLFYISMLLCVLLGVACILITIMLFSPGVEIFGLSYFKNTGSKYVNKDSNNTLFSSMLINEIVVETNAFDVTVEKTDNDVWGFNIECFSSGLTKEKDKTKVEYRINFENNVLTLTVTEPSGWLFFSQKGTVKISCPKTALSAFSTKKITAKTNSGSIHFGSTENNAVTIGSLQANTKSGDVYANKYLAIASGSINISSDSGKIDFKAIIPTEANINSKSGKVFLGKINGNLNLVAENAVATIDEVTNNFDYYATSGVLVVNKIGGYFKADRDVVISNIKIIEVHGQVLIPNADTSTIKIGTAYDNVGITTKSGSVTIGKLCKNADIETLSGNIDILIKSEGVDNANNINLLTKSGKITARFINVLKTNHITSTSGRIDISFYDSGITDSTKFILSYETKESAHANWITSEMQKTDEILYGGAAADSENKIIIKTENSINISNQLSKDYVLKI